MKKLLIASPTFLPHTSADMQRVRMMLPHLSANNWQATVLCAAPHTLKSPQDPLLETITGTQHEVVHYRAASEQRSALFGIRNLGWRSLLPMRKAGAELLAKESFDGALLSSTMFASWPAALHWKRTFHVPFVVDLQDPWLRFSKRKHRAPGHPAKALFANLTARRNEPRVMRAAAGVITVSSAYRDALLERYSFLTPETCTHVPFSAAKEDFDLLDTIDVPNSFFKPNDDKIHLVYVGRLGDDMIPALNALFRNFKEFHQHTPNEAERFHFHFIGTSYASRSQQTYSATPIALNWQLLDFVSEYPQRVPYLEALQALKDSSGVIILGSSDAAYSPSKLFPALLAQKKILCLAAKDSNLSNFIRLHEVPLVLWDYTYASKNIKLFKRFLESEPPSISTLSDSLKELALAENMTRSVCQFLDRVFTENNSTVK